ncbi:vitamin B12 transporter [Collimonas sp. PA-H2]|uniref:TonB-dependent receptor plug domain-containing protein n=1 Tax=Collimonas sp. PA-H2 TaxID=1881062 RepID=UPI000BF7DA1A|nr:TonB-dependent receptor [Collimonas sp. PA-H2]PFH08708.1 vitamin B12 transporter [Collimonas sp. PA-H2]
MTLSLSRRSGATLKPLALASAILSCSCGSAFAQTVQDQNLAPVVVTAARVAQPQTDALPHTTVISAEDIRNSQAPDLPALLERQAGIQITRVGGPGQQASLFMRGANTTETLILIDGVPIRRQASYGSPALENILPDQIDHIEIVRGNVSAIYGSGAIGGVVQIFTKRGNGAPAFNASVEAGSRGTYQGNVGVSGKSGDTRYALALTRFKTDGFSAQNPLQSPNVNPDRNGNSNTSVSGSVSQEWSKGSEVGARIYANDAKYTYDDAYGMPTDQNRGHSKSQSIAVFSKNNFTQDWTSTLTLSQNVNRDNLDGLTLFGNSSNGYKSTQNLLQWANELRVSPMWTATAGVDAGREKADVNSNSSFGNSSNSFSRSTSSVYAGALGKIGAHQLQLNLRHDDVGGSGSDNTGYLGYGYALTDSVKLIANASTAFNAPTPVQLFDPLYGNANLKAERSKSYELGVQYAAGATLLRATLFDTRTHDQFGYNPATFRAINIARSKNQGLELSASATLLEIDWRASLTLQDPKDESTGKTLVRRAKTLGSFGAAKSFGAWRLGTDVQYTDSRSDIPGNPQLAPYWLTNANVRYQLTKQTSLFGRIENLFNRDYQTAYGYNQPSRGLFVGVNWQQ